MLLAGATTTAAAAAATFIEQNVAGVASLAAGKFNSGGEKNPVQTSGAS